MGKIRIKNEDMIGKKYGKLTVIEVVYRWYKTNMQYFCLCSCECGISELYVLKYSLLRGHTTSCGCNRTKNSTLNIKKAITSNITHGKANKNKKTKEYNAWIAIKQRCFDKNHPSYMDYGGRGVTMFPEWKSNFKAFLSYVGEAPTNKHSIDRIDVNGNYEPNNVRWATSSIQSSNRRLQKSNSTGVEGVTFDKKSCKYIARITIDGKRKYLGSYKELTDAKNIVEKYRIEREKKWLQI